MQLNGIQPLLIGFFTRTLLLPQYIRKGFNEKGLLIDADDACYWNIYACEGLSAC